METIKITTAQEQRESARDYFEQQCLTYNLIGSKECAKLISFLKEELKTYNKAGSRLKMRVRDSRKKDIIYNDQGAIKYFAIRVEGSYFDNREAITFNTGKFIGFAGWADRNNIKPFVQAFRRWVTWMVQLNFTSSSF